MLAAPLVVLGPLALHWVWGEARRSWPVEFLQVPAAEVWLPDVTTVLGGLLVASLVGAWCFGRADVRPEGE